MIHEDCIGSLFPGRSKDFTDYSRHNSACNHLYEIFHFLGELQLFRSLLTKTIMSEVKVEVVAMSVSKCLGLILLFYSYFGDILKSSITYG